MANLPFLLNAINNNGQSQTLNPFLGKSLPQSFGNGNPYYLSAMNNNGQSQTLNPFLGKSLPQNLFTEPFSQYQKDNGVIPSSAGVKASNPNSNITPPVKTLTPAQTAPTPTAPKTFNSSQNNGLLAALARQKAGTANTADNNNLAYAQKNGWTAPVPAPAKNSQGLTAQQMSDYANGKIDINGNPITNANVVGNLVNKTESGPAIITPAVTGLMGTSTTNSGTSGQAYTDYQNSINDLQTLKQNIAKQQGNIENSAIPMDEVTGRENALQAQNAAYLDAAQQRVNEKAAALGYQIQGTQTQQAGYNAAGGLLQTGQNMLQSGLGTAGQLTMPQQVPYGTPLVNPQTGQNINMTAAGVDPSDPFYKTMQNYAQLMVNNQGSAIPSSITGNSVLNSQLIKMAQDINPNFNVNVATGAGAAQGSSSASQYAQIESWRSSLQQGQNLQSQFTDLMNTYGLNPSNINKFNSGIQTIASNTSDPRYKMFNNYIADIANTYAQILTPAGGNVSDYKTQIANSMLDASMKGTGLIDVMKGLDQQAQAKIAGISTGGGLGGNTSSSSSSLYSW
jgi:hypothetical protein